MPDLLSLGEVQRVLQNLLAERVSIRDLVTILETLADTRPPDQGPGAARRVLPPGARAPDHGGATSDPTARSRRSRSTRPSSRRSPTRRADARRRLLALDPGRAERDRATRGARQVEHAAPSGTGPRALCSARCAATSRRSRPRRAAPAVLAYNEIVPELARRDRGRRRSVVGSKGNPSVKFKATPAVAHGAAPQIREELGPDAVILSQRESVRGGVGGFFGTRTLEVLAADRAPVEGELPDDWPSPRRPRRAPVELAELPAATTDTTAPELDLGDPIASTSCCAPRWPRPAPSRRPPRSRSLPPPRSRKTPRSWKQAPEQEQARRRSASRRERRARRRRLRAHGAPAAKDKPALEAAPEAPKAPKRAANSVPPAARLPRSTRPRSSSPS